jgi:hypothetical protein
MGLRQDFRFEFDSPDSVRQFLRGLGSIASLDERAEEFFVFSQQPGEPEFTFDCELTAEGLRSERAGEYFAFLGLFVEALTGHFGGITVEDT